jgi:hypothetical protein
MGVEYVGGEGLCCGCAALAFGNGRDGQLAGTGGWGRWMGLLEMGEIRPY